MSSNFVILAEDADKGKPVHELTGSAEHFFGGKTTIFEAISNLFGGLGDALKPIIQTGLEWAQQLEIPNIFH